MKKLFAAIGILFFPLFIILLTTSVTNFFKKPETKEHNSILKYFQVESIGNISVRKIDYFFDEEFGYTFLSAYCRINSSYLYGSENFSGDIIDKEKEKDTTIYKFLEKYCLVNNIEFDDKRLISKEVLYVNDKNFFSKEKFYKVYYLIDKKYIRGNQDIYFFAWYPEELENVLPS